MSSEEKRKKYYISDYLLFQRVKDYTEDMEDPFHINKEDMVDDLRARYNEYARKKRVPFRVQVLKMYQIALETLHKDEDEILKEATVGPPKDNDKKPEDSDVGQDPLGLPSGDAPTEGKENEDIENGNDMYSDLMEDQPYEEEEVGESLIPLGSSEEESNCSSPPKKDPPNLAPVLYMQSLQKMAGKPPLKPKHPSTEASITISSEDEDDPSYRYPKVFHANGPVKIQRVDIHDQLNLRKQKSLEVIPIQRVKVTKRGHEGGNLPTAKKAKTTTISTIPNVSFKLFGGFSKILQIVSELVVHMKESEIYKTLGVKPPRGFLLHGPPGCGKTLLAQAIAGELEVPMIRVAGPELVAGITGESESRIRDLFDSALEQAPCILFIDEIDAICPPRETAKREMERRIVAQLLTCIDGLGEADCGDKVVIIGATNRPDALDPALRRAGRFDREVCLGIPGRTARKEILEVITEGMKLKPGLDLDTLSAATPGFVGADLKALTSEAAIAAVNRCLATEQNKIKNKINANFAPMDVDKSNSPKKANGLGMESDETETVTEEEGSSKKETVTEEEGSSEKEIKEDSNKIDEEKKSELKEKDGKIENAVYMSLLKSKGPLLTSEQLESLYIEMSDFEKALKSVQPSAKREGFATVPDVKWDDIGSLRDIRSELERSIMMPVKYPNEFALLGINAPTGILLCGPPGCGKTLLAKAVANEANINFISVKGPELLNMYVGESERAVRQCFQRARNSQPCVIFFDEIDALCPKRGEEGNNATSRVVNQVLTEMDGVEGRTGVFLMAATNRPDMVDPAVLRPGRLDKILFVGLPSSADRSDILRALTKNGTKPPMKDVNLHEIGSDSRLEGFTGADLAALIKEASLLALTEYIRVKDDSNLFVTTDMIFQAAAKIRPSVPPKARVHYEKLKLLYGVPSSNYSSSASGLV